MRAVILLGLVLFVAGCLEQTEGPATEDPSPSPATSTPVATEPPGSPPVTTTPTPAPSPSPSPSPSPTPPPAGGAVAFRSLASGSFAGIQEPERVVITDEARYEAFWARVREDAAQPAPAVDFASETVVGVAIGGKSNTCWAVRVTNATDDGYGTTSVTVTTYSPSPDLMCGQAFTYPWHLVALEGSGRDVTFSDRTQVGMP